MRADKYWESEAGQFLSGANRYLNASGQLVAYHDWLSVQTPALHLLSHGIELLLKFPLIEAGLSQKELIKSHRHDLVGLWETSEVRTLRQALKREAEICWERARSTGNYDPAEFQSKPAEKLDRAIAQLSYLHSRDSNHALRYTIRGGEVAPKPRFIGDTFRAVAEKLIDDEYYLDRFRNEASPKMIR